MNILKKRWCKVLLVALCLITTLSTLTVFANAATSTGEGLNYFALSDERQLGYEILSSPNGEDWYTEIIAQSSMIPFNRDTGALTALMTTGYIIQPFTAVKFWAVDGEYLDIFKHFKDGDTIHPYAYMRGSAGLGAGDVISKPVDRFIFEFEVENSEGQLIRRTRTVEKGQSFNFNVKSEDFKVISITFVCDTVSELDYTAYAVNIWGMTLYKNVYILDGTWDTINQTYVPYNPENFNEDTSGYDEGYLNGYNQGFQDGITEGRDEGWQSGFDDGYEYGQQVALENAGPIKAWSHFLVSAVGGVMNFELYPGLPIWGIFAVIIGLLLLIAFLKFFAGG